AGAVLDWAAVARAGARERQDIADCALSAAESRQAAARHTLDAERELHRLQQRYDDAQRRQEALEARRPEREALHTRMERGRKAERVTPALRLRDDAEREHDSASEARDLALAGLPPELHEAGAEQLSELERKLRQDLGGLDAARRAERRSEEIGRERADLDRQARADDDILQDAAAWLSGWESLRRGHQEHITAAQEAATAAEHLAGRLAPARRRLHAALERDRLAARAEGAAQRLRTAHERANSARERWLDLKERRLRGIAAELAAGLLPGEPCAVCGSPDHPDPARAGEGHVDHSSEESAYEGCTRADEAKADAERELAVVRESLAAAREAAREGTSGAEGTAPAGEADRAPVGAATDGGTDAVDPDVSGLRTLVEELDHDHQQARRLASGMHAAREALDHAEREHQERLAAQQEAGRRAAARTSGREALDREQASLAGELVRARGGEASVAAHADLLERRVRLLTAAAEAVRAVDLTAQRLKDADDRLADAAFRAGFDTPRAAADAMLSDAEHRDLQHRIDDWQREAAAVADRLAEPETRDAAGRPPADPESARAAHDTAERALRDATSMLAAARGRTAELGRLARQAASEVLRLGPLREEYDRVARLAGLTAGTSADNERKMRLESYVLAARLEQVAAAATARLQRMSAGRYTLVHSDARAGGRRSGLGLHVVDAWTGSERDTATLSGGETFFASLALALGLADVVTDEAGGVQLDTLFIDEGFGSLDEQTLDEVIDVLDSLRERDRSVGIVSHVPDLRRRIPTQLEVVKERNGSVVRLRTAPLSG
ncbi:SbcC/MukB-like Walker B domain-containing protein, partial [Streptomyces sp. NPDC056437]|uniref:SbcC/MukB-like Walker B domain-containing protein n=1 Tax=Streptomyces sp. NPDC056437 TaxID=3345816 RepID=UPI0036CCE358